MNRNDRKIAIAALTVGALALLGFWVFAPQQAGTDTSPVHQKTRKATYYATPSRKVELFPFDPNTADSTQLLRLGLQSWQVRNIYKYRSQGGVYQCKEDFARLYGLTVTQYRTLEPYIRISKDYLPASILVEKLPSRTYTKSTRQRVPIERDTVRYPIKLKANEHIILNVADTAQLKKVPGIGSYYAKKILRYGEWLGGYVSVNQLDEIEGFPKDAKRYFVIQDPKPRKLNVNRLELYQLRKHPYINYYQAKTIVDYRRLHGKITSLRDLSLSRDFPAEAIQRLAPYVEY